MSGGLDGGEEGKMARRMKRQAVWYVRISVGYIGERKKERKKGCCCCFFFFFFFSDVVDHWYGVCAGRRPMQGGKGGREGGRVQYRWRERGGGDQAQG